MTRISKDVLISGGGVAGMTAAAAFGSAGFSVLCVDPAPPVTEETADGADLRTTAFLQPSLKVLKDAGLWDRLAPYATELQTMRIVDAGGKTPAPRITRDFNASDLSEQPFGWNLPNWLLRREMVARLTELPNVEFRTGVGTKSVLTRDVEALVTLTDGTRVSAKLLIAADGRNSPVREAVGIGVRTMRYGQKALAFAVTHPEPHHNVSTEIHRSGGPFTLVPLPDRDGKPCSAIVWMEHGPEALRLASMPEAEFNAEMTARSGAIYGPLNLVTRRTVWPIISQIAERFHDERTALIAEAAHVVPPIGAQGLNMSLADTRVLLELSRAAPADIGNDRMLELYNRRRRPEVLARVTGIDMLNRVSMRGEPVARDLRAAGIAGLYSLAPVRKTLMRAGMGVRPV
ncbi:2-octaprenyl-6-methoxyphenol hydroxylase [Rhodovulum sp. P5]|uniref:UbiH/UbiF family hydroxylase n=1 Tax=Rhodovulum sp. P5 TaxID=1564506 RepID=UPI0009C212CB|nr:UbiH/UbiF family hydroxylase [Rhodovulum sp. P5]ARE41517.1 2-octaprenyl-6-methoxyphenol hydroxylase [Rhodovulum sp. P5]